MEDFLGLALTFIIYLSAVSFGKKKKQIRQSRRRQRRSMPMRTAAQGEQTDVRNRARDLLTAKGFEAAFEQEQPAESVRGETDCDQRRMHLHETTQAQMHQAKEGEDPCHIGGLQDAPADDMAADEQPEQDHQMLAQDILRGVVMSEILTRPCERMAMQRGRRRA